MPSVSNAWGGAAETLEMSGADFALSELARAAGREDTAETFAARAQWWQNNFNIAADPTGGYIADRKADGSWVTGFTPATGNGFVEGTAAQYTWMVPHNPAGLFAAMGGRDKARRPASTPSSTTPTAAGRSPAAAARSPSWTTSRPSTCPTCTPTRAPPTRRRRPCGRRCAPCGPPTPAASPATTTSARCRPGTSSRRSACTRRCPRAPNSSSPHRCSRASRSTARTATTSPSARRGAARKPRTSTP